VERQVTVMEPAVAAAQRAADARESNIYMLGRQQAETNALAALREGGGRASSDQNRGVLGAKVVGGEGRMGWGVLEMEHGTSPPHLSHCNTSGARRGAAEGAGIGGVFGVFEETLPYLSPIPCKDNLSPIAVERERLRESSRAWERGREGERERVAVRAHTDMETSRPSFRDMETSRAMQTNTDAFVTPHKRGQGGGGAGEGEREGVRERDVSPDTLRFCISTPPTVYKYRSPSSPHAPSHRYG